MGHARRDVFGPVGGRHEREVRAQQRGEHRPQAAPMAGVQPVEQLVEQQQAWPRGHGTRHQREPLLTI